MFSGTLQVWNNGNTHGQSGDRGWWFDFSTVSTPGSYYIYDMANQVGSFRFEIGDQVYDEVLRQAVRMFFYQRINFAKNTPYVDAKWVDGACYGGPNQDKAALSRYDKSNPVNENYWHPYNMGVCFALLKYAGMPNASLAAVSKIRSQKANMNYAFSINNYQNKSDLYRAM